MAGFGACKAADECHLLDDASRPALPVPCPCESDRWERSDNYDELESFCYGACARSCGAGSFDMGDASRFQTWEECRCCARCTRDLPALGSDRDASRPLGDEVWAFAARTRVFTPTEALPEDRWNYRDTERA